VILSPLVFPVLCFYAFAAVNFLKFMPLFSKLVIDKMFLWFTVIINHKYCNVK
jgi:hypothetical protein